jgi:soluble lytic murein transglycosylase-like protein
MMADLREAFRIAIERVDRESRLSEGWTVEAASDWVWARSHLSNWQHLVAERGWSPDDYERLTVRSILDEVLVRTSAVPGRQRHSPDYHRRGG